ncbi:MAG TPA: 4-(cytidine 5'-diphospho)-2-C-methyl-D-erythritol kinase [Casimicrobiaceae bacterium]|nr:4-(cytidine 5'-diphospho)-2-C-methyl-D-erythritol kinase [Casimicrobiaceae bacterium]
MTGRTQVLVVPAPAKVNLFLHVTGRRDDGYHTLESLFSLIDLADTLTIEDRDDGRILRAAEVPGVPESEDLTLRAARVLRKAAGTRRGAAITLDKRIPRGAGLGGGSSDAASVLLALNRLWSLSMSRQDLAAVGVTLGADIPFFLGETAALARGIGERLTPMSVPQSWLALAVPPVHIATASIFAAPELTRSTASAKIDVFSEGYGRNDLESVAAARFPQVAEALHALRRASPDARMTGSGACVFAVFATAAEARAALALLPAGISGQVLRTVARHPLASFAS